MAVLHFKRAPEAVQPAVSNQLKSDIRELSPTRTAARTMIEALVEAGVTTFFGIPGGPAVPVFDAILGVPGATLIESRHETAAAFEAAGYHRATGRVAAVVLTAGPGITNAVTGIASAHLERVPMLVITGDVAWAARGGKLAQDSGPEGLDVEAMLAKLVRAAVRVAQPRSAATQALTALHAATNPENPGPALIVVPIHHGTGKTSAPRVACAPRLRPTPPPTEAVVEACRALAQAERPLIVLGGGCRGHEQAIRRMLDAFDIPFVTTPRAKGLVSELHPRSLRHGGLAASMWARRYTDMAQGGVDVALVLGTDLDDSSVGATRYIAPGGQLFHVDTDPSVFARNFPTALAVVADVGAFADAVYDVTTKEGLRHAKSTERLTVLKAASPFDQPTFVADASAVITPARALGDLEAAAGTDARFVSDIGEHMLFALHYLTARTPDSFHIGLGLGSMGSGIAGAIGLALGDPSRRVVCVCGDGGMQMIGMEALVAVQHRLPILFAVFNDGRYNMVFHGMKDVCGREAPWEAPWVDFDAWGRAIGLRSARIHGPGEITPALVDDLLADGPALLDIRIDRSKRVAGGGRVEALTQMSMLRDET